MHLVRAGNGIRPFLVDADVDLPQETTAVGAGPVLASVRAAVRDDLQVERAMAAVDAWAEAALAAPIDDPDARASVRAVLDSLLGLRL